MTIYVLVILIAVGLAQVYFLVRLQRGAMDLMRIEERAGRLDTAVHVLTDTCETGFRSIAREIGRAPAEMSPLPKKGANRRLRTAARTGESIAAIAAAERMSEGEVRLRLQMPSNGRRTGGAQGNGGSVKPPRGASGKALGQAYANGDGYRGASGYRNGDGNDAGHRNGNRTGRREAAAMHFEDDLLYDDADFEQELEAPAARPPRTASIPRNAAALRAKQQPVPPPQPKKKKKKNNKVRVAQAAASVAPKKVTEVRHDTDVITNGHANGNGNGNGNGHALAHDQTDGHGGDTGMGVESDGGPKEGKSRGTVRPS
jgi:hypothetical protein